MRVIEKNNTPGPILRWPGRKMAPGSQPGDPMNRGPKCGPEDRCLVQDTPRFMPKDSPRLPDLK